MPVSDDLAAREGNIFCDALASMRLGGDFTDKAHLACERHPFGISVIERFICSAAMHGEGIIAFFSVGSQLF